MCHELYEGFRWNFASGTSKELDYMKSPYVRAFTMACLKSIKNKEGINIQNFSPRKREASSSPLKGSLQ